MTLTLRAVSLNGQALSQPIAAHFDASGGTIGRSDASTLALPDPERHISRRQAQIEASGSAYLIKNVGGANPIFVRGESLAKGQSAQLRHHDKVRIGGYLLEVVDEQEDEARTVTRGRAGLDLQTDGFVAAPLPPASELGKPLSSSNPFAGLIGPPAAASEAPAARVLPAAPLTEFVPPAAGVAAAAAAKPNPAQRPSSILPPDFDPFRPPPVPTPSPPAEPATGDFSDLIPVTGSPSIDELIRLNPGASDPLAAFMADIETPADAANGESVPVDPMAALFRTPAPVHGAAPPMADDAPLLNSAYAPPVIVVPTPQREVHAPAEAPANDSALTSLLQPSADATGTESPVPRIDEAAAETASSPEADAALWDGFCEGAGIGLRLEHGLNAELMRTIGGMMRMATDGIVQLVGVRAATKHELRAEVTMIQARNNNPIKFSPDGRAALEALLQPPTRGFLPGPSAMSETMNDLVGHSIGTMAGMRAALEGMLERFAPTQLESKLSAKTLLDNLVPINRKAKLWELYLQHFDGIRAEAQEDFHALFGKAFVAAYEQQLTRLQGARAGTRPRSDV